MTLSHFTFIIVGVFVDFKIFLSTYFLSGTVLGNEGETETEQTPSFQWPSHQVGKTEVTWL